MGLDPARTKIQNTGFNLNNQCFAKIYYLLIGERFLVRIKESSLMTDIDIVTIEKITVLLLLIASAVAVLARRLRIPYTVGLVLIGLVLSLLSSTVIKISPQIILALLVPPLIFEAAFHLRWDDLRRDFWLILLLAIPGVKSLFNDGTAIVMFNLMISIALAGRFNLASSVRDFIAISGGGVLIGITFGVLASQVIGRIQDPLVETTLTTVLAFGSYLVAEYFHVSGVLAVVAAGITNGNAGPSGMSATTRVVVFNFWEYAAFLANSFIFLLIGLTFDLDVMIANWQAIIWAILAALAARALSIYGFSFFGREIPRKWKHILFWGGLRGAITLALALSLPETNPLAQVRGSLQAMAFGVVLFTLLVQGSSTDWLVERLKLIQRSQYQEEYELRHARFVAGRAAYDYLRRMTQQGLISEHTWQKLSPVLQKQNDALVDAIREVMISDPAVEAEDLETARREALRAQRNALRGLLRDEIISESSYSILIDEVDSALLQENLSWPEIPEDD